MKVIVAFAVVLQLALALNLPENLKTHTPYQGFPYLSSSKSNGDVPTLPSTYDYRVEVSIINPESEEILLEYQMHMAADHKEGMFFQATHDIPSGYKIIERYPDSIAYAITYDDDFCMRFPLEPEDIPPPPSLSPDAVKLGVADCKLPTGERTECDVWTEEIEEYLEIFYYFHHTAAGDQLVFAEAFSPEYANPILKQKTIYWSDTPEEGIFDKYGECDVPPARESQPASFGVAQDNFMNCHQEELCHVFSGLWAVDSVEGHFLLQGIYKMPDDEEWTDTWTLYRGDDETTYSIIGDYECQKDAHHKDYPSPHGFDHRAYFLNFVDCDTLFGFCELWYEPRGEGFHNEIVWDGLDRVPMAVHRINPDQEAVFRKEYVDWILERPQADWFDVDMSCYEEE